MEDTHSEEHENGGGLTAKASEKVREIGEAARGQASEKVREISEAAREQASERVRELTEKAREKALEQVEDQRVHIASRVEEAASSLKQHAEEGDNLRYEAERRVARGLEGAASYLQSHQTNEVAGDLVTQFRQHPVRSVILAAVIGFLLGKLLR